MRALALFFICGALAACELREVTVAQPEDFVVAEIYLRTDQQTQFALLHRTVQGGASSAVTDAKVEVRNSAGAVLTFLRTSSATCITPIEGESLAPLGSCYVSVLGAPVKIMPGQTYHLTITLADGGVMTGTTRVPDDFTILRPATKVCALPANDTMTIQWTKSEPAWVYAAETNLHGLKPALQKQGIEIDEDPLRLFGLSITNRDTTMLFPTAFGVFQRLDEDLIPALLAIKDGLPAGVVADVVVAAGDRNYVNWERGGQFNPSGTIRVPSIRGAGTGVFGSLVPQHFQIRIGSTAHPPC